MDRRGGEVRFQRSNSSAVHSNPVHITLLQPTGQDPAATSVPATEASAPTISSVDTMALA